MAEKLDVRPVEELDIQPVEGLDIQPVEGLDIQPVDSPDPTSMTMEEEIQQYGAWKSAPPPSKWNDFKYWFRTKFTPFIGPSEEQVMEEGVMWTDPITQERGLTYKPLGDKFTKQGIFNTPMVDYLDEKFGFESKDLQELGFPEEWAKGIAGVQKGYLQGMEQLSNPILGAAAAVSATSQLAGRGLSAAFGVHMAAGIPDIYETFEQAVEAGDTETAAEALTGGGLQILFAAKATQHALGKNLAIQSPRARRLITNEIKAEYTGPQLRTIYERVNRNEGTPAEVEMVKFINGEMKIGRQLRKGETIKRTTLTQINSKLQSNFFKRYMGLEDVKVPIARRQIAEKAGTKGPVEAPEAVSHYMKPKGIPIPMSVETAMGIPKGAKTTVVPPKVEEPDFFGKSIGKAKDLYRKWLTSKGRLKFTDPTSGLTVDVHARKGAMEGRTLAELKKLDHISAALRRAEKSSYDKKNPAPENLPELMNSFLAGEKVDLPKPIIKQLAKMRVHRKKLSKELQGLVTGELKTTIGDNMEVYLHRSYEIFDNPGFKQKVLKGKGVDGSSYEVAKNFLAKHRRADLAKEAENAGVKNIEEFVDRRLAGEMEAMLNVAGRDIFDALPSSGRVMDIVKRRKEIPTEIRELWGEYKTPYLNYARTVTKMADFIQKTKFYNELRETGLNRFLFEKPFEGFSTQIGGGEKFSVKADGKLGKKISSNPRLAAIDGLYTTKEFAEVLTNLETLPPIQSKPWRIAMAPTAAANISATVLSHVTQFRNVYGAGVMGLANNRLSVKESAKAMQNIYRDISKKTTVEQRKTLEGYAELGLFDQAAVPTEMMAAMKDIIGPRGSRFLEDLSAGRITKRGLNKLVRTGKLPFDIYQGVDAGMRIANFEVELARYSEALKISPKDPQLRQEVGNIIKDTYPTYSRVPLAVQSLRRFPLLGTFVSFPAEVIRTTANTYKLALKELKTPELRAIGAKRLAAMTGTLLLPETLTTVVNTMSGISGEEETALRRFVPPWSANGNLQMTKDKDGHWKYIDLKYSDPYSYLKEPLLAALRSEEEPDIHFYQAYGTLIAPFSDEKIFFKYLNEAYNNQTESGRKLYEEVDSPSEKSSKILTHLGKSITPGSVKSVNRLYKAAKGEKGDFGREYDLGHEAFAQLGFRTSKLDIQKSLSIYKLPKAKSELNSYAATFGREIGRQELTVEQQQELYRSVNENRFNKWQSIYRDIEAAQTLGVSMVGVESALRENGFNKEERAAFREGTFIPYKPSDDKILEIQTSGINTNFNFINLFDIYTQMNGIPLIADE